MRKRRFTLLLLSAALVLAAGHATSEEEVDVAKMMELWKKYGTPDEHHKALGRFIGTYDVTIRTLMPGSPPMVSKGIAETKWLMKNRWLQTELEGAFMGMPYREVSLIGFDIFKKKYVMSSVNTMTTAMGYAEGVVVDPKGPQADVIVAYGTVDEFLTGEHDKPFKVVHRIQDEDHYTMELWDLGIGESGAKVMEYHYSRKAKK